MINKQILLQRQSLGLDDKILLTNLRIRQWYQHWHDKVYVAFSGGKDSTVLLDLVRKIYPDVPAVFVDTGLEFPEIREFVKTINNVLWLKPKMSFKKVIEKYGYPVVSKENSQKIDEIRNTKSDKLRNKRMYGDDEGYGKLPEKWKYLISADFKISNKCCNVIKKNPSKKYERETDRKPFVGTMATDSKMRKNSYVRTGCNSFDSQRPMSIPLGFWNESNIWDYIKKNNLKYSKIYDMGYDRTGCMFCMFGCHLEKTPNRFILMNYTHPKLYNYCMNNLGLKNVLSYMGINH